MIKFIKIEDINTTAIAKMRIRNSGADIALLNTFQKHGILHPIKVRETIVGKYELLDGLRRIEMVSSLGGTEIIADVVQTVEGLGTIWRKDEQS